MRTNHVPKDISERDSALSWFESLILAHVNAKLFQIRLLKRVLKREKKGVLDRDPRRKPDSRTCERKALSERDLCVCILECALKPCWSHAWVNQRGLRSRNKISLAVRRSWSWLGRRLQCMWTHVNQITISITFWITFRSVFRNVIRSHVNTAYIAECLLNGSNGQAHNLNLWTITLLARWTHSIRIEQNGTRKRMGGGGGSALKHQPPCRRLANDKC